MKKPFISLIAILCLTTFNPCKAQPLLKYLNQTPPSDTPVVFAPGIISTGLFERDIAISKNGDEIYFCVAISNMSLTKIAVTKFLNGKWTKPEIAEFSKNPEWNDIEPCISPDGNKFYFASTRPNPNGSEENYDIWVMDKTDNGWGKAKNLGTPVNTNGDEFFPSLTKDGTIYFTRSPYDEKSDHIFRAKYENGTFQQVEKLGKEVNCGIAEFNAFISPDESYIIVCVQGRKDSIGPIDYYIVFRNESDKWSKPINLGDKINTKGFLEYSPYVSRDGNYFFFMATRNKSNIELFGNVVNYKDFQNAINKPENGNTDIYWVNTNFIKNLKETSVFEN